LATYPPEMGGKVAKADAETGIAKIAERQYGMVSVSQLRKVGIGEKGIRSRVAMGRLHRVHRGVYAVGHAALSPEARCLAAVLAVGGGPSGEAGAVFDYWRAAVSHRSAAGLWGLLTAKDGPIDVVVEGDGGRKRRLGIRVHRSLTLSSADVTVSRGIPVTTPARTISDLRRAISERRPGAITARELRKVMRQANVLGLPIDEERGGDRTRSDLEWDFLWLCRRHRLPPPEVNVRIGPYLVDFLWHERRLVVETDSYIYHGGRVAFQDDRGRDLDLRRLGYDVLRLSERQINEEPDLVADTLASALA
jgi:very-short-patch-repair endonuclease